MKSITLSNGIVYFEGIVEELKKVGTIVKSSIDGRWGFIIDAKIMELIKFSSEEQAKIDRENFLLFINQCKTGGDE